MTSALIVPEPRRIYIAHPYTIGDKKENVRHSKEIAQRILEAGHVPINPLLSHHHEEEFHNEYEVYMRCDFSEILTCHLLYRALGESPGADREVAFAKRVGVRIYYDFDQMLCDLKFGKFPDPVLN